MRYRFTRLLREDAPQVCEKLGKEDVVAEVYRAMEALLSEKGEVVGFLVRREDRSIDDEVKEELDKFFIGTKEGVCPLCERNRELLVVRDGITACMKCLESLAHILESAKGGASVEELKRLLGVEASGQDIRQRIKEIVEAMDEETEYAYLKEIIRKRLAKQGDNVPSAKNEERHREPENPSAKPRTGGEEQ